MKTKLLAMMLLAGGSMFAETRFSVGIGFGGSGGGFYQAPPSYAFNTPPCPGPDYTWVDGYWSQDYGHRNWVAGYWNRQPFRGRFDNRFRDRDDRRAFGRDFDQDRSRGFDQSRNFSGQGRDRDNGNRNRSNDQDFRRGNGDGFRGR